MTAGHAPCRAFRVHGPTWQRLPAITCGLILAAILVSVGPNARASGQEPSQALPSDTLGYSVVSSDGGVFTFGDAGYFGSAAAARPRESIVGMARTPSGDGYWLVGADGSVRAFGDAVVHDSAAGAGPEGRIVGIAATPSGNGYWLVAENGGIFAYGDAQLLGRVGAPGPEQPIVGMAPTTTGRGYWLAAANGDVFAFGDAQAYGSPGGIRLARPIAGIVATTEGYLLVGSDGAVFAFGNARYHGSTAAGPPVDPVVGMASTPSGDGYWLASAGGGIFAYGDASLEGGTSPSGPTGRMVGIAVAPGLDLGTAVKLRAIDGGPAYFAQWPSSLPTDPSYFPIGVWFESVLDQGAIDEDMAAGINTYVALTADSDLELIARNDMRALPQWDEWIRRGDDPGATNLAGWLLADEIDMVQEPLEGADTLRGILRKLPAKDGRLRYNNYGKGVLFWETDADAARFVNEFQDVVSADAYWFTDERICGRYEGGALFNDATRDLTKAECHRAANYGATVDRVRSLVRPAGSKPVWNFVEVGHPFSEDDWPSIRPAEASAAVWSSIIHGARGIVYFNHSFGGPAETQHVLREPAYAAVRAAVTETNRRIRELAVVLNAPFADGLVTAGDGVDVMAKYLDGAFHIFAGSRRAGRQTVTFSLRCEARGGVAVAFEDRSIAVEGRTFTDVFADGNAVHIYRIDDPVCG